MLPRRPFTVYASMVALTFIAGAKVLLDELLASVAAADGAAPALQPPLLANHSRPRSLAALALFSQASCCSTATLAW